VAEEAVITAQFMEYHVETLYDVGVAGIHRLLSEGAIGGGPSPGCRGRNGRGLAQCGGGGWLTDAHCRSHEHWIWYQFCGITALLAMLNSCASGVAVVNIDNGFGAGYMASLMNRI